MYNNNNNQFGRGGVRWRSLLHYWPPAEGLAIVPASRTLHPLAGSTGPSSEKRLRVIMTLIRRNRCRLAVVRVGGRLAAGVSRAYADKS